MTDDLQDGLPHDALGSIEYVVSDGVIYEPARDSYQSEWYFVRRGEFDESQLEGREE